MFFISAFLKDVLEYIYRFVGNYGWSVVLFTLLIRLVVLPLDIKSRKSMRRMAVVQPKMEAIQKKYANDRDKMNQKMNELYRKERVNPLSGCLPMLLSLPILFCMFDAMRVVANEHTVQMILNMMNGTFDASQMQSFMWIKNVYQPDSFMASIIPAVGDKLAQIAHVGGSSILTQENIDAVRAFLNTDAYRAIAEQFGASTYVYSAPLLFWTIQIPAQFNGLFILPLLAGASQFFSSKLMTPTGQAQSAQQQQTNKMMTWFFPIFSIWICSTSTAAFSIYWVAVNILQIVQQYFINLYFERQDKAKPEEVV